MANMQKSKFRPAYGLQSTHLLVKIYKSLFEVKLHLKSRLRCTCDFLLWLVAFLNTVPNLKFPLSLLPPALLPLPEPTMSENFGTPIVDMRRLKI